MEEKRGYNQEMEEKKETITRKWKKKRKYNQEATSSCSGNCPLVKGNSGSLFFLLSGSVVYQSQQFSLVCCLLIFYTWKGLCVPEPLTQATIV